MSATGKAAAGIIASVSLSVLTLAVFSQFQMAGPQGVMMRFLEEIQTRDAQGALALTSGQATGRESWVLSYLYSRLNAGAYYRVIEVRRLANAPVARVRVTFHYANADEATDWIVARENHAWKIDLRATMVLWGVPVADVGQ